MTWIGQNPNRPLVESSCKQQDMLIGKLQFEINIRNLMNIKASEKNWPMEQLWDVRCPMPEANRIPGK